VINKEPPKGGSIFGNDGAEECPSTPIKGPSGFKPSALFDESYW